ncbi:MAG: hypothetical protein AAGI38_21060, partial [Bacteroidota bacterium]
DDPLMVLLTNHRGRLSSFFAEKAGEVIYSKLDFATIDLLKENAQDGDILYLYLVLSSSPNRPDSSDGISNRYQKILPIGNYKIRSTGWQADVFDKFSLINRIDSPDSLETTSPSNFKGAPGISLLASYKNDGRRGNKIFNFIQPSIGIDVSYIDFSTTADVEIGVGPTLGLFKNQLFFTYGINLNLTGSGESSPTYFGLGLSFANLAGIFD